MSFKAKFKVAGKERNILAIDFGMLQETDATGRPSSVTRGGKVNITVEGTGETDLFEWMTNSFERKDGSIVFLKRDSEATLKELKFKEAYIVKYKEEFDASSDTPLTEVFTISAKEIELGNAKHINEWV
ncbi:phage tail protein [Ornithobacterium rhinotracheale]|uniref:Phage tail protein n=1 Tax=Ornithobacterium rhinotracheale TaxID=28251 RepID=A0A410JQ27_ORNRH|nr:MULTISPECIES: type VI secretion system tube protein TssD [Weeksellaceae]MDY3318243.1 type VI secretion system tube protein TssD [Riemerella anatipestifer]MDY3324507.1 type VI secretion system tube protein TssD [Riemerella anatipestifer]MDY3353318.1 type VI secretion system tube protein TssD [Riemerella anatipestifer]MDY3548865.1 type VI secretion system tube protein TssD [Riemerella anatipestifer]MEC5396018.1 type VI secretion system tube protein TssD [Bergeyella sp. RCAD1439]